MADYNTSEQIKKIKQWIEENKAKEKNKKKYNIFEEAKKQELLETR